MRRIALTLTLLAALLLAPAPPGALAKPAVGSLASIESQFICTSCHEPLELVSSPQAISEQQYLAGLIRKGLTMREIKAAMVSQYGIAVLAKPPAAGFDLTVYVLPPAIVLAGLLLLGVTLPKWRARARRAAITPLEGAPPLGHADARRLEDELERLR